MQTPGGSKIVYSYDLLNRPFTVTHPDTADTTFQYGKIGNRQSMSRATSATAAPFSTTGYIYDILNRLTDIVNANDHILFSVYTFGDQSAQDRADLANLHLAEALRNISGE